VTSDDGALRTW